LSFSFFELTDAKEHRNWLATGKSLKGMEKSCGIAPHAQQNDEG
jgi:hypothetical protein